MMHGFHEATKHVEMILKGQEGLVYHKMMFFFVIHGFVNKYIFLFFSLCCVLRNIDG